MEALKSYTSEQVNSARRIIDILMSVPEDKRPIVTAVTTAYIDGVEAGTRIIQEAGGAKKV